jgi:hypothetical protein
VGDRASLAPFPFKKTSLLKLTKWQVDKMF